ncbi:MAG: SGNH/GDSL hydrolase family protein [Candidatus Omnitrophica bacterium]|nr:SGNH/GDSL hydrolase family protein [Candidatus Omnitrophota bacterium]
MEKTNWFETHRLAARFILIGVICFMSFGVMELILWGAEYYEYVKPANRALFDVYRQIYSDERDTEYIFGHNPDVNVLLMRRDSGYTFITNSEGLREKENYEELDKSVIFLGDSIVEGVSVENDETMDAVFENETGITALNFGVGSSNTVQEYLWLKNKYKDGYNTKLIILGFCLNDLFQNSYLRRFVPERSNWALYRYLEDESMGNKANFKLKVKQFVRKSKTFSFLYRVYTEMRRKKADVEGLPPYRYDEVSEINKKYTKLYIQKLKSFAESIGSEFVVVIFPREKQLTAEYSDTHRRAQEALIEILEENNVEYIDLYALMKENYIARPDVSWYHDDTHPYKKGHQLIGLYLAERLPEKFPEIFK